MLAMDNYVLVDDRRIEPVFMGAYMADRRKKKNPEDVTAPIVKPIPFEEESPSDEVYRARRGDEDTKDLIWESMRDMIRETRRGNTQIVHALNRTNETINELRKQQDTEDLRHAEAQVAAAKEYAAAQAVVAEKATEARKFEAKVAGGLGLVLIIGLLVVVGIRISGEYGGAKVTAGGAGVEGSHEVK